MLNFKCVSECPDAWANYIVDLDSKLTLQGLINAIENERLCDHHGRLYISTGNIKASVEKHDICAEYEDGVYHLTEPDLMDRTVIMVSAHGGFGLMDYFINLEDPEDKPRCENYPDAIDGDIYLNPFFGDMWIVDGAYFIKINDGYRLDMEDPEGFIKVGHVDGVINKKASCEHETKNTKCHTICEFKDAPDFSVLVSRPGTVRLTARDKEAAIAAAKNLPPDCFTWANEYDRMEARPVKDMDAAKDAVQGFVRFEAATSQIYPWATPEEQILSEPMLTNIAKDLTQREDGSYDTDELYGSIEKFAGINPVLNNKN